MRTYGKAGILGMLAVAILGTSGVLNAAVETAPKPASTLDNLQASYAGESNAKARYEAFAAKATEEGYLSVAALFKAAANSEGVHVKRCAEAIEKLGVKPAAVTEKADVKTTRENLESALKGENNEWQTLYPSFIKQADADKNVPALYAFKGAQAAEAEHAKMFQQALGNLDGWKEAGKAFLVCQVCGYTTMDMKLQKCPVCDAPRSKFELIQ